MADSIMKCVSFYTAQETLDRRVIHYHLEYGNHQKDISVVVTAAEMQNADDLDECKTLANIKAAVEKNVWLSSLAAQPSEEEVSDLNGSVSL